jgi:hypothetical protein
VWNVSAVPTYSAVCSRVNGGSVTTSAVGSWVAAAQRDLVATVDREFGQGESCSGRKPRSLLTS